MSGRRERVESFDLPAGRIIAGRYVVEQLLGAGWEGEVYRVTEARTGIQRAAKLFYPQRNVKDQAVRLYATKLDRLRRCPIIIQYHHTESFRHRGRPVTCMISELVEGQILEEFVRSRRGGRLTSFEALHLIHALVAGLEEIHLLREYHGDVHDRNVLVRRKGVGFDVKLLDFYHWGRFSRAHAREDLVQLIHVLHDAVGGRERYASQPVEIKRICKGLRRDLILREFPTASHLRLHLESFAWE